MAITSLIVVSVLSSLFCSLSWATEPAQGTLSPQSPEVSFSGGPYFVSNPLSGLPGMCALAALCDIYQLDVDLPAVEHSPHQQVRITLNWSDAVSDLDFFVLDEAGEQVTAASTFSNPEVAFIPALAGKNSYQIVIVPYRVAATTAAGRVRLVDDDASPSPVDDVLSGPSMRFAIYSPPDDYRRMGRAAGEPSIAVSQQQPRALALAGTETLRVDFDDRTSPARTEWRDVSSPLTSLTTLDPVMESDRQNGRVFVSQLLGTSSLFAYSDDDGTSWKTGQLTLPVSGFDHQGIGVGPYPKDSPFAVVSELLGYGQAVYYCSQAVAAAFCARSDDGGRSFGPAVPIYTATQCAGFHGKPKVDANGTVYIPMKECNASQAVIVSEDAGLSWTVRPIPDSSVSKVDPFIGLPPVSQQVPGLLYVAYVNADGQLQLARSQDGARSFSHVVSLSQPLGLGNVVFPVLAVGDPGRLAVGFVGTDTPGDFESTDFPGLWYAYVMSSLDDGLSWGVSPLMPQDPVQAAGGICLSGLSCSFAQNRNLLEFNDIGTDHEGRVHMSFADGCIDDCARGGENSFAALLRVARQSGGPRLYAAFDPPDKSAPAAVRLRAERVPQRVSLSWDLPDNGGEPIQGFRVYRAIGDAPLEKLADLGRKLSYEDHTTQADVADYQYVVTAMNSLGEGEKAPRLSVPMSPAASIREPCFIPGELIFEDPSNDDSFGLPSLDLREVYLAEPAVGSAGEEAFPVVISLRIADLSNVLPGSFWQISWLDEDGTRRFARARSNAVNQIVFEHGRQQGLSGPIVGALGAGSAVDVAQDLIILELPRKALGLPESRGLITAVSVRTGSDLGADTGTTAAALVSDSDSNTDNSNLVDITLRGGEHCRRNRPPRLRLQISPAKGPAPLRLVAQAAQVFDPDGDAITAFSFSQDWRSRTAWQSDSHKRFCFEQPGYYAINLIAQDARGAISDEATAVIEVTASKRPGASCWETETVAESVHIRGGAGIPSLLWLLLGWRLLTGKRLSIHRHAKIN